MAELSKNIRKSNNEVKVLEVRLKEKDQELKLAELKVKELRKQIPNTKLKPLNYKGTKRAAQGGSVDTRSVSEYEEGTYITGLKQESRSIKDRKMTQQPDSRGSERNRSGIVIKKNVPSMATQKRSVPSKVAASINSSSEVSLQQQSLDKSRGNASLPQLKSEKGDSRSNQRPAAQAQPAA